MNKKTIIAIIIIFVVVVAGGIYAYFSFFNTNAGGTTSFDNDFMSGSFVGSSVVLNESSSNNYSQQYNDTQNNVLYNVSTADCFNYTIGANHLSGFSGPEKRTYNDVQWHIYTAQGKANGSDITYNIYVCNATANGQSYLITIMEDNSSSLECDGSLYCKYFTDYVVPLLESISLKKSSNVPHEYDILGLSQSVYTSYLEQIDELINK